MSVTVSVEELKPGMFVHLDLGWWAHPFALSSFVLSSQEQIDTIRGLGLKSLRISPEKSQCAAAAAPAAPASVPALPAGPAQPEPAGAAPGAAL